MNDHELTLKAAKAGGINTEYDPVSGFYWIESIYTGLWWDALHRDYDAFRLMVKLNLKCKYHDVLGQALVWDTQGNEIQVNVEDCGCDPNATLRRAIVIAAAKTVV